MPANPGRHEITLIDGSKHLAWVHPLVAEGDELGCVAMLPGREPPEVMDLVAGQAAMACAVLRMSWGVSREGVDAAALPRSFEEARVAASASRRLGGDGVCLYEQLGIVRLLR